MLVVGVDAATEEAALDGADCVDSVALWLLQAATPSTANSPAARATREILRIVPDCSYVSVTKLIDLISVTKRSAMFQQIFVCSAFGVQRQR